MLAAASAATSQATDECNIDVAAVDSQQITCSNFDNAFTLTIPECAAPGLIVDIHGLTMSAAIQEANTNSQAIGGEHCFAVLQPSADGNSGQQGWKPLDDHENLLEVIEETISKLNLDRNRIHAMGMSQGGFATWNLLCMASDLFCSVAPLAASGLDPWGAGYGENCFSDSGPATPRSILYASGTTDPLANINRAREQKQNVVDRYGFVDNTGENIPNLFDDMVERKFTFTDNDLTFQYVEFGSEGHLYPTHKSHCFPTLGSSGDTCDSGRPHYYIHGSLNHQCCAEWTWAERAVQFFVAHPCSENNVQVKCQFESDCAVGWTCEEVEVRRKLFGGVKGGVKEEDVDKVCKKLI